MLNLFMIASEGFSFHGLLETVTPEIISIIELIGILVITVGSVKAFSKYLIAMFNNKQYPIKIELGNALALGLEFKMGAEILKTVLIRDMSEIFVLGAIIVLRAFLALLIHYEVKAEMEHGHAHEASTNNY
ncbi:MAG: DUF1622 domain-containing protein [Erysipelotrichaceae bacterium]